MKTYSTILKLFYALCCICLAMNAFGQTTYIWTNQAPNYPSTGNLDNSTNWDPNGLPSPGSTDVAEWNGSTTGNLALTLNSGFNGNSGNTGIQFYINASQTGNLQIGPPAGVNSGTPRVNGITIDAGAGQFTLGDDSANSLELVWGSAFTHELLNDSTQPAIIKPNIKWRMGGGGTHTYNFDGTGDWIVNSYVVSDNNAGSGVTKGGTGTLYWYGTNVAAAFISGGVVNGGLGITAGKVVLETYNLLNTPTIQLDTAGAGGTMLVYNAPITNTALTAGVAGTMSGVISGSGPLQVNAGSLALSGANTYTGSNYLTGGELIAAQSEIAGTSGPLGVGGLISFAGGALGYSTANSYDYSPRFDASAGQAYNIDVPAGGSVSFATGLTSSGGTLVKSGAGTLTLAGTNTYAGSTTVSGGTLVIQGTLGNGILTVADGQALGVLENGTPLRPGALTLGTTSGANLQFFNLTNTTTAPIAVSGAISAAAPIAVTINSGLFKTIGSTYPLISWGSGSAPAVVNPPSVNGADGILSTNGNTIMLTITATPYVWTGGTSGIWNTSATGNWEQSGSAVVWENSVLSLFDDTALANTNVTITGDLLPTSVTVNNSVLPYSIISSTGNLIDGTGSLTKNGNSTLVLSGGANAYTGVTTVSGGTLIVNTLANGGSPSDIGAASSGATNLVLNGGTLQYVGSGAAIDRQFSVGTAGGALDASGAGALNLAAAAAIALPGSGVHVLTLTGTNANSSTLAANLGDSSGGATALNKNGSGTWILLGTNTFSGATTISAGTLQIGNGGGSGSLGSGSIVDNSSLDFNSSATIVEKGVISGTGSLTNDGTGTTILANNTSYTGPTIINAGTLQVGNGGTTGSLAGAGAINNNSKLVINNTGNVFIPDNNGVNGIHGTGNLEIKTGTFKCVGSNDYTGWTMIDSGAVFTPDDNNTGNAGILSTSVITNNGTLRLEGYTTRTAMYANIVGTGKLQVGTTGGNYDSGDQTLGGTNTYTGGTFIGGAHLVLGDGTTPGAGSIVGNITFVNNFEDANDGLKRLIFDRPDDFTFSGNITTNFTSAQTYQGIVDQNGTGTLTLTGTNTYASGTEVNSGYLTIGNGGPSGSVGSGPVTLTSGNPLVINRTGTLVIPGVISSVGGVTTMGSGTIILGGANTYTGSTIVSNGTLVVSAGVIGGDLNLEGGTYIAGGTNTVITNTVAGTMNIDSGTLIATLNKSTSQSNTFFQVAGAINVTGGSLKLVFAGPLPAVGEKYYIFSGPTSTSLPVVSPGFTVKNNLAVDGSVMVTSVQPLPLITSTVNGSGSDATLTLAWPSAWTGGVHLQVQTNTLAKGLGTNWVTIPGTDASNEYSAALNSQNGAVFYRLVAP